MTLITVDAVVHIPIDLRVVEIVGIIGPMFMTVYALEDCVVISSGVARRALAVRISMVHRELRVLRVVEGCPCPRARGVTGRALRGREEYGIRRRGMRRVSGAIVIALMARDASIAGQVVIVINVAVGTYPRRYCMLTR